MNHLNLAFILSASKLTNKHFKIKNEIDPQCFLPLVRKVSVFTVQCLLYLRKKGTYHSILILSMMKAFKLNIWACWVLVYYKFTIEVTY